MSTPTVTTYMRHHVWPVLDDTTGRVDYYDVHHPDDAHGEGDPVAELLPTRADAHAWIRDHVRDMSIERAFDRMFSKAAN
jgi:hypothetical protein